MGPYEESSLSSEARPHIDTKNAQDSLKGFAYLENFSQLFNWSRDGVDPLQRSNTPLVPRSASSVTDNGAPSPKIMLIHDYRGGYNDYEACQGAIVEKEMYSCEYLQYVETFVYFSHKLVTIPPSTWINTCHRNGVHVLGTFIVEPGSQGVESILEQDETGSFWVARQLADIAHCYGFDGWLINIEVNFPVLAWKTEKLEAFLCQLRAQMGSEGKVVWYDALTTLNFIWYRNSLDYLNLPFALAAGSMLTNYAWTPELAKSGRDHALSSGLGLENIYFGIDVWAQNTQHGPNKRVTYPVNGGGGTCTGLGIKALKEFGLNAGVFAPGWSFEHFDDHSRDVERAIWEGKSLPVDLACECNPKRPHDILDGLRNGIKEHITAFPAGSKTFFHTNFERAFSRSADGTLSAHLGSQSILPFETETRLQRHMGLENVTNARLVAECAESPPRCTISVDADGKEANELVAARKLAGLGITCDRPFEIRVLYQHYSGRNGTVLLRCEYHMNNRQYYCAWEFPQETGDEVSTLIIRSEEITPFALPAGAVLTGLGIFLACDSYGQLPAGRTALMDIYSMSILPQTYANPTCDIVDVKLEHRKAVEDEDAHVRLTWNVAVDGEMPSTNMPYSAITGPCSHFVIETDGVKLGRAYALAFVLSEEEQEKWTGSNAREVKITGFGFGGTVICQQSKKLSLSSAVEEDWIMVSTT